MNNSKNIEWRIGEISNKIHDLITMLGKEIPFKRGIVKLEDNGDEYFARVHVNKFGLPPGDLSYELFVPNKQRNAPARDMKNKEINLSIGWNGSYKKIPNSKDGLGAKFGPVPYSMLKLIKKIS